MGVRFPSALRFIVGGGTGAYISWRRRVAAAARARKGEAERGPRYARDCGRADRVHPPPWAIRRETRRPERPACAPGGGARGAPPGPADDRRTQGGPGRPALPRCAAQRVRPDRRRPVVGTGEAGGAGGDADQPAAAGGPGADRAAVVVAGCGGRAGAAAVAAVGGCAGAGTLAAGRAAAAGGKGLSLPLGGGAGFRDPASVVRKRMRGGKECGRGA